MKYLFYILSGITLFTLLTISCSNNDTGVVDVKWDRDACERCRMVLSDRHFAAQVRGGPKNKAYLFDDLGCAVHWLQKQKWGETAKIWVTDYRNGKWLDARTAHYVAGQITPMDFEFGAVAELIKGSVDFATAKAKMLAKKQKSHKHNMQSTH